MAQRLAPGAYPEACPLAPTRLTFKKGRVVRVRVRVRDGCHWLGLGLELGLGKVRVRVGVRVIG